MRWRICRPLEAASRIFRRMSASSLLAVSAMVSSSRMAERIFSSKISVGVQGGEQAVQHRLLPLALGVVIRRPGGWR